MFRTQVRVALLLAAAFGLVLPAARASTLSFEANLDGLQEVPPNASPAFGLADITVDDVSGNVTVTTGTYQDLLGNSVSVAIYDAAVGSNGPSILALTNDTIGATTGTFSGSGAITLTQVADMVAGNTYVNIRSNVFLNGEIRGQFFSVPEPSGIVLGLLAGLGLLAAALRRRVRSA
jgi:hypothetical protein